jgi:poly(3-hydroxybutyrate) depolymerase
MRRAALVLLLFAFGCGSSSQSPGGTSSGGTSSGGTGGTSSGGTGGTSSGGTGGTSSGGSGGVDAGGGSGGVATGGGAGDAGVDAPAPVDAGPSRCTETSSQVTCAEQQLVLDMGQNGGKRTIHYNVPLGSAPAAGWPVVIMFQGAYYSAAHTFTGNKGDPWGGYYQTLVVKRLLDGGLAVLAPEANQNGNGYWDTNISPYDQNWKSAPDNAYMLAIFQAITGGKFGPLDDKEMYAAGLSSGGYMTSRMAVSYAGRFRALAIESASYATCLASQCTVPAPLPSDHPPTLFLHGGADQIVPISTMKLYKAQLDKQGIATKAVIDNPAGHGWIAAAPDEVPAWFSGHP